MMDTNGNIKLSLEDLLDFSKGANEVLSFLLVRQIEDKSLQPSFTVSGRQPHERHTFSANADLFLQFNKVAQDSLPKDSLFEKSPDMKAFLELVEGVSARLSERAESERVNKISPSVSITAGEAYAIQQVSDRVIQNTNLDIPWRNNYG